MGFNKSFVVKNGIEVSTDLLVGEASLNNVGVGTTVPSTKLDVVGSFQASGSGRVTGISTAENIFNVGMEGKTLHVDPTDGQIGVHTNVTTNDITVVGDTTVTGNIDVTGITTTDYLSVTNVGVITHLDVTGVTTVGGAVTMSSTGIDVTNIDADAITGRDIDITGNIDATTFTGDGSAISGIVTTLVAGENISISGATGTVTITGLAKTDNISADTLVVSGVSTLGQVSSSGLVVSGVTTVGVVTGGTYFGDGSNLSGLDSGNFSGKTVICENVLASSPGIGTFGSVVINNPAGRITATEFYGNGANLTNTGSTLEGIDSTERLVTTGIATGNTMVSSGTTSTLTYNPTTDTLSCTNFSGDGANLTNTGSTLQAISGVERLITTGITTGNTMVSSGTTSTLTYNGSTDTLFCTNLSGSGNATFSGLLQSSTHTVGDSPVSGANRGTIMYASGGVITTGSSGSFLFYGYEDGDNNVKVSLMTDGSASFGGDNVTFNSSGEAYFAGKLWLGGTSSSPNVQLNPQGAGVFAATVTANLFSGSGASLNSIPNGALNNSTISGVSLGSNLATLTRGSYLTGSNYNGSTARTWAVDATSSNTASKVVARDSSGNFSAGTITATLSGQASAANDTKVDSNETTNATRYITFVDGGGGSNYRQKVDSGLTYNPSTNTITATLNGNASTASNATNAGTLDGIDSSSFLRSDADDSASGTMTFNGRVNIRNHLDLSDSQNLDFGSSQDVRIYYYGSDNWLYCNFRSGNGVIFQDNGVQKIVIEDSGIIRPAVHNAHEVGTSTYSFGNGNFYNFTVNSTLSVRGAIDLADNDILRFGSGDDAEFFCNGSHFNLDLNSGIGNFYIRDGTTTRFTFDDAGSFTATGDITSNSDIKLKTNIQSLENSLEKVNQLRGVSYDRVDMDKDNCIGVIAQEVEEVYPEFVSEGEDGIKSVDYSKMVAVLIEAVKELTEEVNTLKSQLNK